MSSIREVVAVFDATESLEGAVFDLETNGFDRAAFSLLSTEQAVERKLGHRYRRIEEMEDEPAAPRDTFFSRASRIEAEVGLAPAMALLAVASAGLGSAAMAIPVLLVAGAGAAAGAVLGMLVHRHHAERLAEQLSHGGLLLWVNVRSAEEEKRALDILGAHGARHLHAHDIAQA